MIKNPYGFVYITTNMIDGMRYIGRCKFNRQRNWKYYMGSGVRLLNLHLPMYLIPSIILVVI